MKETLRKVGAAVGSALMLGTTLAGAAFAGDISKFYTDYAVKTDGTVNALLVVGDTAASADVVSAIGIAAEIGQKALKTTAGAGSVELSVKSTKTDGKTLTAGFGLGMNQTIASSSNVGRIEFKYPGQGVYSLSTLGTGSVSSGTDTVKYYESIALNRTDSMVTGYANAKTVTPNTDNTNGFDSTVLEASSSQWLQYDITFDKSVNVSELVSKAQKMRLFGKEYVVTTGSAGGTAAAGDATDAVIKLSGAGVNKVPSVGETFDFTDGTGKKYTVKLDNVGITGTTSATVTVTPEGGTPTQKLVYSGSVETVAGLNVNVLSASETVTSAGKTASANLIIGGEILELASSGQSYKVGATQNTDYVVSIKNGNVAGSLKQITIKYNPIFTSTSAIGEGVEKKSLSDLVTIKYVGPQSISKQKLKFTPVAKNFDSSSDGTQEKAIEVVLPQNAITETRVNSNYQDRLWVLVEASGSNFYPGMMLYQNTSTAATYEPLVGTGGTNAVSWQKDITIGTQDFRFNTSGAATTGNSVENLITFREPVTGILYGNEGEWRLSVFNGTATTTSKEAGTNPTIKTLNYTATRYITAAHPAAGAWVAWTDTNNVLKTRSNFISAYGTIASAISTAGVTLDVPTGEVLMQMLVGSTVASEETSTIEAGKTGKVGGVDITVKSAGATGKTAAGIPLAVAKLASEVGETDKSTYNLVLVGGPVVNTLVQKLVTDKKLKTTITNDAPGKGKGVIEVVDDAFAIGKVAVVVAGSDRDGTRAASQLLQQLASNPALVAAGKSSVTAQFVSATSAPTVVA